MLRRNLDLVIVAILAIAGLLAALLTGLYPVIRGVLSVPLLIALPGYALTAALIPDRHSLGRTERTVLGVGMSIVLVILSGLALNLLPAGITNVTVALSLAVFCLLAASDPNVVQVGIRDEEGQALQYRIEVETQGQVLRSAEIDLNQGQD